jgi:hypothetical protein
MPSVRNNHGLHQANHGFSSFPGRGKRLVP